MTNYDSAHQQPRRNDGKFSNRISAESGATLSPPPQGSVNGSFGTTEPDISGDPEDIRQEADEALDEAAESTDPATLNDAIDQAHRASAASLNEGDKAAAKYYMQEGMSLQSRS